MEYKPLSHYQDKADASFRTKLNVYLFSKSMEGDWQNFGQEDFIQFEISDTLLEIYTTIYWQYEADYPITPDLTNDKIQKEIAIKEIELRNEIEKMRFEYINGSFKKQFSREDYESFLKTETCAYCGITIHEVTELANNQNLFKKNYRGWSLEIDRKDSNKEYYPENCVMACYWCNNAKTDEFTYEEFKVVGKAIREIWEQRLGKKLVNELI
jgi:hypothetical protein